MTDIGKEIVAKLVEFIEFAQSFDCENLGRCSNCPLNIDDEDAGFSLCGKISEIDTEKWKK